MISGISNQRFWTENDNPTRQVSKYECHILFKFSIPDRYTDKPMGQSFGQVTMWQSVSRLQSSYMGSTWKLNTVLKFFAAALPFCMTVSKSVHWQELFCIAVLSIIFFLSNILSLKYPQISFLSNILKSDQLYSTQIKLPWSLYLCWVIRVVGPNLEIPFCAQPCSAVVISC